MGRKNHRRKSQRSNKHHIIPRSRGGTSHLENISELRVVDHEAYHTIFVNQTPDEIVETLVNHYWNGQWEYVAQAYRRNNGNR